MNRGDGGKHRAIDSHAPTIIVEQMKIRYHTTSSRLASRGWPFSSWLI